MWGGGVKSRGAWWMLPSKPWVDCLGRRGGLSLHCSQNKGWKLLEYWTFWVNIEKKFPFSQNCSLKGLGLIVRWRILFHESICKTRVTMYQDSVQCWSETGEHTPRGLPVRESKGLWLLEFGCRKGISNPRILPFLASFFLFSLISHSILLA